MKIKVKQKDYSEVLAIKQNKSIKPWRTMVIFRVLLVILCFFELLITRFKLKKINMDKLGKREPCLYLMNHSAFIDAKIASCILFPRAFNIIASTDAFIGKNLIMRLIGCVPARKYIADTRLVKDMLYCARKLKSSILMFPEAGYSFDGTATTLPESLGKCIKLLNVPVVMIRTYGAFARDPLYNGLQLRKVRVRAEMEYLLSPDDISKMSADEINSIVHKQFASIDNFRWQQENEIFIDEKFRADGLNRVLYKCPHCLTEGKMIGKGTILRCDHCNKEYELTELGYLKALNGETEFAHIPDWYKWERECVRKELEDGTYKLDTEVDICTIVDTKCVYNIGSGRLVHDIGGFHLEGCNGRLDYHQKPLATYCINADYLWYEIGDMISIGDKNAFYYCFPKICGDIVTKTRLAAEELYKLSKLSKDNNSK